MPRFSQVVGHEFSNHLNLKELQIRWGNILFITHGIFIYIRISI